MPEVPDHPRRRLRDRFWPLNHSASPSKPQNSNAGAAPTPLVHAQALPSSSADTVTPALPSSAGDSTTVTAPSEDFPPLLSIPTTPAVDLWSEARKKLSESDQQAILMMHPANSTQWVLSERIAEFVDIIEGKKRECDEKSYKFHFQGKEIIVRDVAAKTVKWLQRFKDVGDIAVNFDPVHAALPWAGIRFMIQVAVGEHEQMGGLLLCIEKFTYLTNRCMIYESLYNYGTINGLVLHNLYAALVELYTTLLRLMALAYRLFNKNTATRALHAVFNPVEIADLLTRCEGLESRVETEAQNCQRKEDVKMQSLLESLRTPIFRIDARVSSFLEKMDDDERLRVLNWISNTLYGKHHNTVKEKRTKVTCEWLLRHARYREWQDESCSTILWLHGTAGTGKTYLTSRVIDDIRDALRNHPNHEGLAFFYCNRNEAERQEPLSVLRSFVRQLSTINDESSIQAHLRKFCKQAQLNASELTESNCKDLLLELINLYPKTTLILDALDECEKHKRSDLIEIFDYLVAYASKPVKIFISSRPDGDIRERFKSLANINIQATDNCDDISRFVESEITRHRKWKKMRPKLQEEIIEKLQMQSQGMFQWAYLQIKQLLDLSQEKDIQDRLGKLPEDLKDAYEEIYSRMSSVERKIADRAFKWVMCYCEPISTEVLLHAVCQDEDGDVTNSVEDLDEDLLLEYCHNLLVIDDSRKVWVPSHLSVIEYFENNLWSQTEAHYLVASVCLSLLNDTIQEDEQEQGSIQKDAKEQDNIQEDEEEQDSILSDQLDEYGLSVYVRHHWMIHVQNCGETTNSRISALLKQFLGSPFNSSSAYQNWYSMVRKDGKKRPESSFFNSIRFEVDDLEPASSAAFAICAFGFYDILSDWWKNPWTEYMHKSKQGCSLLQLAAIAGSISICNRLINWGAEINEQVKESKNGSVLAAAAYWGNQEVVELLIKSGAEVNMQLQVGLYGSALAAAAAGNNKEVVELLIKSGAEVNMQLQIGDYGSVLAAAVYWGSKEVVELLIKSGAEVNMQLQVGDYGSTLAAAVINGDKEIIKLLIESGADVNMQLQVGKFNSALAIAEYHGYEEVLELLVKSGAKPNKQLPRDRGVNEGDGSNKEV